MILYFMAVRKLSIAYPKNYIILISSIIIILISVSFFIPEKLIFKLFILVVFFLVFSILTWKVILDSSERFFVLSYARKFITTKPN